jgi:hypothetical protein
MWNMEGIQYNAQRESGGPSYLISADPGSSGGGTYSGNSQQPTLQQYESIFGPAGRDVKIDSQRHKRHQRWHLPDALKGPNTFLTDRVDGLITDATNSPFTRNILPYKYIDNPDQKFKWNVYSFDEGMASRVPYEAAARVLPQSKRSFAGYIVRQGLAIAMEHNFMLSAKGRENFKNQLTQLVGSIQLTNDLDVHVALLQAPSYQRHMSEKYYDQSKTVAQLARQYTDIFGIMQKHPNALDILIEDAKNHLRTWGAADPSFLMTNGKLTAQMTMNPEKTNYLTNGPDGAARLAQGPDLPSYRGLSIIHSRKFSLDTGTAPRDLLRRKVRVAQYHWIKAGDLDTKGSIELYDQSRDSMFRLSYEQLLEMGKCSAVPGAGPGASSGGAAGASSGGAAAGTPTRNSLTSKLATIDDFTFIPQLDDEVYTWNDPIEKATYKKDTLMLILLHKLIRIVVNDRNFHFDTSADYVRTLVSVISAVNGGRPNQSWKKLEVALPSTADAQDWQNLIFKYTACLQFNALQFTLSYLTNMSSDYSTHAGSKAFNTGLAAQMPSGADTNIATRMSDLNTYLQSVDLDSIQDADMAAILDFSWADFVEDTIKAVVKNIKNTKIDGVSGESTQQFNARKLMHALTYASTFDPGWILTPGSAATSTVSIATQYNIMILRPNIEHEMLSVIMGRGGDQELGCTFWGQTELSCYDDAQHGIWGMSYKYHERAMVLNEKNLIRVFDVAFDGYNGGMDQTYLDWNTGVEEFRMTTNERTRPYTGPSMIVMLFPETSGHTTTQPVPNPLQIFDGAGTPSTGLPDDPGVGNNTSEHNPLQLQGSAGNPSSADKVFSSDIRNQYRDYLDALGLTAENFGSADKTPGEMCIAGEASGMPMAFEGTMKIYDGAGACKKHVQGSGHLGPSYVGVASIREGRGVTYPAAAPTLHHLI